MTHPVSHLAVAQRNVRLVAVDDAPRYVKRAEQLERRLLATAAKLGVEVEDLPGLHELCLEAVRSAEVHGR